MTLCARHDLLVRDGRLSHAGRTYACALGHGGIVREKREGDGGTPVGRFPLRYVYFRADRLAMPQTALPCLVTAETDGWCDDPADTAYNRPVTLPYPGRHETLWRADHLYDAIVVLGHNDRPPRPGRGSAIFLHVAAPGLSPTAGCVALALPDLLEVLLHYRPGACLTVMP